MLITIMPVTLTGITITATITTVMPAAVGPFRGAAWAGRCC